MATQVSVNAPKSQKAGSRLQAVVSGGAGARSTVGDVLEPPPPDSLDR